MASGTKIEWTDVTWNPVTGCTKVSEGCRHCYAEVMARRLQAMGQPKYRDGFLVRCHDSVLPEPLSWTASRNVFVNSMGDLFHEEVPVDFIRRALDVMASATQHRFQILTKRASRLRELAPDLEWAQNVWAGVTVENSDARDRLDALRSVPSAVRFVSFEPLLGDLGTVDLTGIQWVIAGGESGPGARPVELDWVRALLDQSVAQGVPFFFKQWGGVRKKLSGRLLDGRVWDEMPAAAHARRWGAPSQARARTL